MAPKQTTIYTITVVGTDGRTAKKLGSGRRRVAMTLQIPAGWKAVLAAETRKPYYRTLQGLVASERRTHTVYPPARRVFAALALTPYERVRVVLLGQDPYPGDGEAHGLCFSVRPGVPAPPSLVNIFRELVEDIGGRIPNNGSLVPWARQGVLMLNTTLTVRAHEPGSHKGLGWETFTDAIIHAVSANPRPVIFVLWGREAQHKVRCIDRTRHPVITGSHPSPRSATRGFFGSRPFSEVNRALRVLCEPEIDWRIRDL